LSQFLIRYIYVIHIDWLDEKFPDPKKIGKLVIFSVFATFFAVGIVNFGSALLTGWPSANLTNNILMETLPES
jgi:hypothetical protein